jgi:ketosteroid isomerase-like protein
MKNVISAIVVVVLGALLISCAPPKPDIAAIKASIEEYNKVLAEAMVAGNNDTMMAYYAEGAISLQANGPMLRGKEEIKKNADQMHELGMKVTAAKFTTVEVDADGNLAYEIGTYDMSVDMGKLGMIDDNGKYLSIWKKQSDGSWKVAVEIWNSSKEMPVGQ